jgi:hypothetical protein
MLRASFLITRYFLREKIGEIIFPAPPSVRPVYVEHTFVFKKEENN